MRSRRARRTRTESRQTARFLGRRDHRLPPPPDRCSQLYAEPRGSRAGLQEGIRFAETLTPVSVELDQYGHAAALHAKNAAGENVRLAAKSILVAAGTQPNTVLGREDPQNVFLDGKWFQAVDENGDPVRPSASPSRPTSACSCPSGKTAAPSASLATCIPATPATSSKRWPALSRATPSFRPHSRAVRPKRRALRTLSKSSTMNSAPLCMT